MGAQVLLDEAVAQEDYQAAGRIRDRLLSRQQDSRAGVEEANRRFYDAFRHAPPPPPHKPVPPTGPHTLTSTLLVLG